MIGQHVEAGELVETYAALLQFLHSVAFATPRIRWIIRSRIGRNPWREAQDLDR